MEKFVEQLNAALERGDVVPRTPLYQKFTEFLKRDDTAREGYNNIRQTGQTMALKEGFPLAMGRSPGAKKPT